MTYEEAMDIGLGIVESLRFGSTITIRPTSENRVFDNVRGSGGIAGTEKT